MADDKQIKDQTDQNRDQATDDKRLLEFLRSFGGDLEIQNAYEADIDGQLKTFATFLSDRISQTSAGSVVDIGCGHGIVLARLAKLEEFQNRRDWIYVAADKKTQVEEVQALALKLGVNRRLEPVLLEAFYEQWPSSAQAPRPQIIICRNVLHELDVRETAVLFQHIAINIANNDILLIQDFQVFRQSEHKKACWDIESLRSCCAEFGFDSSLILEPTSRGNRWFNLILRKNRDIALRAPATIEQAEGIVCRWRRSQWEKWNALGLLASEDIDVRGARIAKLDFELQFAALTFQLQQHCPEAGPKLDAKQEKNILHKTFSRLAAKFIQRGELGSANLREVVVHFRGFGPALNNLEEFLRSTSPVASIVGGGGTGKSTTARHFLCTRAHNRVAVFLTLSSAASAWSIIEQLFSAVGLRIPLELVAHLKEVRLSDIAPDLRGFFNRFSRDLLIYVDDLDRVVDSNSKLVDSELESLFTMMSEGPSAKVIFGYRPMPITAQFLHAEAGQAQYVARVGRFTDDRAVANVLDDFVDRARLGIGDYPQRLLTAIDRHPALAELAGRHIRKSGFSVINDDFIRILEGRMWRHLWERLIDAESAPAANTLSYLRIATPRQFIDEFSSARSVGAAIDSGLLYEIPDDRWTVLVDGVGALRRRRILNEERINDDETSAKVETQFAPLDHSKISASYEVLYKQDDDPKWLRESYFHAMRTGDPKAIGRFGQYLRPELVLAADYWFRRKQYQGALGLYELAVSYGLRSEAVLMRIAACHLRQNDPKGEQEYLELIDHYPKNGGIKSSYIDSLLAIKKFGRALEQLAAYEMRPHESDWVAGQHGRAFMGLHSYAKAAEMFKLQESLSPQPDRFIFQNLARAYQHQGKTDDESATLKRGLSLLPGDYFLQALLAACKERNRDPDAEETLVSIFNRAPGNEGVTLALIKLYCRTNRLDLAKQALILSKKSGGEGPILVTAEAEIETRSGNEDAAIRLLSSRPGDDEHAIGMIYEAFASKAARQTSRAERIAVATAGLQYPCRPELLDNGPILISRGKLAALAENISMFNGLREKVRSIGVSNRESARMDDFATRYLPRT